MTENIPIAVSPGYDINYDDQGQIVIYIVKNKPYIKWML